jgi:hypothetical protein
MGRSQRAAVLAAVCVLVTAVGGCGGSPSAPVISGHTLAEVCAQTALRLDAVARRRILKSHGPAVLVVPSKQARERKKAVETALVEDAAVYAAAIPAVERLGPASSGRSVALANLEEAAHRAQTLRSELPNRGESGGIGAFFAVAEASGGCRKVRAAIGG